MEQEYRFPSISDSFMHILLFTCYLKVIDHVNYIKYGG